MVFLKCFPVVLHIILSYFSQCSLHRLVAIIDHGCQKVARWLEGFSVNGVDARDSERRTATFQADSIE